MIKLLLVFFPLLSLLPCDVEGGKVVSPSLSMVYGLGLRPEVVLPVRYFYIQAVDTRGKNFTRTAGKDDFAVDLTSESGRVRVWKEVLDRNDGSYIVRMRLFVSYKDLKIAVTYKGNDVGKSPFMLKGMLYYEGCNCPEPDAERWKKTMTCPNSFPQILEDLKPFPKIDLSEMKERAIRTFGTNNAVCHYSIVNNEVYRKCYGQHVGFAQFMDAWLFSLIRKVRLPDLEFFSNLGDWPLSRHGKDAIPVLSWCGSDETYDVVMPTYDLTESTLETLGRVSLDIMSVQANKSPTWKKKIERGFFRGRDSRQERLDLTILGRKNTDLFDVGLTNFFFFEYDEKKYGPKLKHISFFDFFKYKYQLNVDGTVAAYRFPYLLAGDSVVLKQDSNYYEHFYHDLEPMKHYIPFKRDLSDIVEKLKWAKSHDAEARKIGLAGQQYARDNLTPDKLYCYSFKLFEELATRFIHKPQIHPEQEHIKMPSDEEADKSACQCSRRRDEKKTTKKTLTPAEGDVSSSDEKEKHEEL